MDDPFDLFRWTLAVVCTIYATLQIIVSLRAWLVYFRTSRQTAILGRYVTVQLLRLRLKRFVPELLQIVALLIILGGIVWYHYYLEFAT